MNLKPHICYVTAPGGGPETYIRNLAPWMMENGWRVSVITFGKQIDFDGPIITRSVKPGQLHWFADKLFGNFRSWALMLRGYETETAVLAAVKELDSKYPVDLIEVIEGIPIGRLKKKWKIVVRIHGAEWSFKFFCRDGGRQNIRPLIDMEKKQLEQAAAVAAISRHSAEHVSEMCRVNREKIEVIPYPVKKVCEAIPTEVAAKSMLLCVGRLEKRKGTDVLCRAMEKVWKEFPRAELYFFGKESGLSREQLQALIPEKNRALVQFMGFISQEELNRFYAKACLYVAPTQYETLGYTLLEAMSFGLPVVTTSVGAIPELVEDGKHGIVVPFGDPEKLAEAIIELLEDLEKRKALGENGRRKALEYSLDKIGPRMLKFYEKTLRLSK